MQLVAWTNAGPGSTVKLVQERVLSVTLEMHEWNAHRVESTAPFNWR